MRLIAMCLLLLGCAGAPGLQECEIVDQLTSSEVVEAFRGRALCAVYPEDGACEDISFLQDQRDGVFIFRTVGASDIEGITTDGLAQAVRGLRMFAEYDGLFRQLAGERAPGNFRYLKTVSVSAEEVDDVSRRLCSRISPAENYENLTLYFSNDLTTSTARDVRLSPESEQGLRRFLRQLAADQEFRGLVEATAGTPAALEELRVALAVFAGAEECWSYAGVVQEGRFELTTRHFFVDGRPAPFFDRTIRPLPLGEALPLRAN